MLVLRTLEELRQDVLRGLAQRRGGPHGPEVGDRNPPQRPDHPGEDTVGGQLVRAQRAGANVVSELEDMFWGDRFGTLSDPFGHVWSIATHKEDLSEEEMAERSKTAMAEMPGG